jgi:hypothetical protein
MQGFIFASYFIGMMMDPYIACRVMKRDGPRLLWDHWWSKPSPIPIIPLEDDVEYGWGWVRQRYTVLMSDFPFMALAELRKVEAWDHLAERRPEPTLTHIFRTAAPYSMRPNRSRSQVLALMHRESVFAVMKAFPSQFDELRLKHDPALRLHTSRQSDQSNVGST